MSKKWLVLPLAFGLLLVGCKSKQESMADDFLAEGKLGNAIQLYTKAEQKGDVSEQFLDNFSRAYMRQALKLAQRDPMNTVVPSYIEEATKMMAKSTDAAAQAEFVENLVQIASLQAGVEGNYEFTLQAFNNFNIAEKYSKDHAGAGAAKLKELRGASETKAVKIALASADAASNNIAKEYELLCAEVVAPQNPEVLSALNAVRLKNRGDLLIFDVAGIESPSRWVNVYGYVMAFPSVTVASGSVKGELVVWNSTGNNSDLVASDIKLFSENGQEAKGQVTGSFCSGNDPVKPVKVPFAGGKGKILSEGTCNLQVSYSFGADFVPSYVEYNDQFGKGRKYFGK